VVEPIKGKDETIDRERYGGYGDEAQCGAPVDDTEGGDEYDEFRDRLNVVRVIRSSGHVSLLTVVAAVVK
jgi:hypothetical protein